MMWLSCELTHLTDCDWVYRQRGYHLGLSCILQLLLHLLKIPSLHRTTMADLHYRLKLAQYPSPKSGYRTPVESGKSPGEQAESTRGKIRSLNQFEQSESCSICKKISSLSKVRGKEGPY